MSRCGTQRMRVRFGFGKSDLAFPRLGSFLAMDTANSEYLRLVWCSFFFSSRRRHTRFDCDWSSDVCSSDLIFFRFPGRMLIVLAKLRDLMVKVAALDDHTATVTGLNGC